MSNPWNFDSTRLASPATAANKTAIDKPNENFAHLGWALMLSVGRSERGFQKWNRGAADGDLGIFCKNGVEYISDRNSILQDAIRMAEETKLRSDGSGNIVYPSARITRIQHQGPTKFRRPPSWTIFRSCNFDPVNDGDELDVSGLVSYRLNYGVGTKAFGNTSLHDMDFAATNFANPTRDSSNSRDVLYKTLNPYRRRFRSGDFLRIKGTTTEDFRVMVLLDKGPVYTSSYKQTRNAYMQSTPNVSGSTYLRSSEIFRTHIVFEDCYFNLPVNVAASMDCTFKNCFFFRNPDRSSLIRAESPDQTPQINLADQKAWGLKVIGCRFLQAGLGDTKSEFFTVGRSRTSILSGNQFLADVASAHPTGTDPATHASLIADPDINPDESRSDTGQNSVFMGNALYNYNYYNFDSENTLSIKFDLIWNGTTDAFNTRQGVGMISSTAFSFTPDP